MQTYRLIVYGKVQKVGYRNSVYNFIHSNFFNIKGYIRNLSTGQVEIVLMGDHNDIKQIEDFCYQGPRFAEVDHIDKTLIQSDDSLELFHICY